MSDLKQDFSSEMLRDIQPIVQQQDSLEIQNSQKPNSMSELDNSFIEGKPHFQTQFQNIYFSDHTPTFQQKPYSIHQHPLSSENQPLFNYSHHNTTHSIPEQNDSQNYQEKQKLPSQSSSYKSLCLPDDNLSMTDELSESFNQNNMGLVGRKGYRRKISIDSLKLTHKDHMLLGGKVISGLQKNIVSLPFREPVDVQRYNIPDYLEIVKQPMDLRTIKRKIYNDEYDSVEQIYADIELIISNSMKYNELNADFVRLTRNFQKSYHKIRRDCERNMRKLKVEEQKKVQTLPPVDKMGRKVPKPVQTSFPSNDVEIMSSYEFKELTKLAKRIKKLQAQEQIQLFKRIGIRETMVIDIKTLNTKQVRSLMREVDKVQKSKEEFIRNEEKKENSHLTTCDNEYRYAA